MNVVKSKMSMKFEDCRMQWMAYNSKRLKVQIININNTFHIHFLIVSLTKLGSWPLVVLQNIIVSMQLLHQGMILVTKKTFPLPLSLSIVQV